MVHLIQILDNALMQGLAFGVGVLGLMVAFRVIRYPDLTADGSYLLGAVFFARGVAMDGWSWIPALLLAMAAGAAAGLLTSLLHTRLGVNRLLTGILTSMMAYSVSFRLLDGRPNLAVPADRTMYAAARVAEGTGGFGPGLHPLTVGVALAFAAAAAGVLHLLLRSDLGLVLRATGANPGMVEALARRPERYQALGLALANALVALAGALTAGRQGFVDVNMGVGVIIVLVAALVIGEQVVRALGREAASNLGARVTSPVLGAVLYFGFYLGILRASILGVLPFEVRPTDLKFLAALVVIGAIIVRSRRTKTGEELFQF